jgi:tetratricopeptide (TPR) repeat protein
MVRVCSDLEKPSYAAARTCYEHALVIYREIGNRNGEGVVLINLGHLASRQGRVEAAKGYYEQALATQREIGDRWGTGISLNELGAVALAQSDLAAAREYGQRTLDYLKENPSLEGAEDPMRAFHFTWEVLVALGETAAADEVLALWAAWRAGAKED